MVLRSFRGGVAERMGFDDETLLKENPRLIYLNAPGFGVGGPYGHRPAYAPVINAGSGYQLRNSGIAFPDRNDLTLDEIKSAAMSGFMGGPPHADGFSALTVGTALVLGLVSRSRTGGAGQSMTTTMLSTMAHVLSESVLEYEGPPDRTPTPRRLDPDRRGFGPLYRIYQASDGWVVLTAPAERDWQRLVAAMGEGSGLDAPSFADAALRQANSSLLQETLQAVFARRPAASLEAELRQAGVGCVQLIRDPNSFMDPGGLAQQLDMVTEVVHPMFGPHLRMRPLVHLSASVSDPGVGALIGQHTDAVLTELGYTAPEIADLRRRKVIGG
jgi:crotonobetainyl-CoA:carnitine CoA-transferase CaiB-like acyl-CoA transferase